MAGYCYQIRPIRGEQWLDTAIRFWPIRAFLPCAVGYKRHCSFIPFNYAVQKRRRLVREHSEELSKNAPIASRDGRGGIQQWRHLAGKFNQSEPSSQHVVDGHPRGVTKGRRRFLYHKTSIDDSGCGSAKVCLPQLCRMPKENDPGLCSTPHCEDDSEVLPTYSTESRGHLRVEHGLPRCSREHSRRFCGRLRRAKRWPEEDCRLARHRDAVQHDNAKNCRWSVHKLHGWERRVEHRYRAYCVINKLCCDCCVCYFVYVDK